MKPDIYIKPLYTAKSIKLCKKEDIPAIFQKLDEFVRKMKDENDCIA